MFIKKGFYINAHLSFYPGILHGDLLFSLISLLNANRTIYINQTYYKHRIHNKAITRSFNINNLYGYLIIYCEIQKLLEDFNFKKKLKKVIFDEIFEIEKKILKINNLLSEEEKHLLLKKINIYQEIQYKNIIKINEKINEKIKLKKDMERIIKRLKKKNAIFKYIIYFLSCNCVIFIIFKVLKCFKKI